MNKSYLIVLGLSIALTMSCGYSFASYYDKDENGDYLPGHGYDDSQGSNTDSYGTTSGW